MPAAWATMACCRQDAVDADSPVNAATIGCFKLAAILARGKAWHTLWLCGAAAVVLSACIQAGLNKVLRSMYQI